MIHVCYGLYDKNGTYSKFTGTSICSMFENHIVGGITVHLLHDNTLTEDNRDKFKILADNYHQQIKFYNVEETCADKIAELRNLIPSINDSPLSIGTLYRLLMLEVLPDDIEKIFYFDSDTVINLDIGNLWQIELNQPLAAVSEVKATGISSTAEGYLPLCKEGIVSSEDYFNSGVLIMNYHELRANSQGKRIFERRNYFYSK